MGDGALHKNERKTSVESNETYVLLGRILLVDDGVLFDYRTLQLGMLTEKEKTKESKNNHRQCCRNDNSVDRGIRRKSVFFACVVH